MVLVRVEASAVCLRLIPGDDLRLRSTGTAKSAISCYDVAISTKSIAPIRCVLNVLCTSQLLLDVFHQRFSTVGDAAASIA